MSMTVAYPARQLASGISSPLVDFDGFAMEKHNFHS